jgi:lysophospholipase L1-like esterase
MTDARLVFRLTLLAATWLAALLFADAARSTVWIGDSITIANPYLVGVNAGVGGTTSIDWAYGGFPPTPWPDLAGENVGVMLGTNDASGFGEGAPSTPCEYRTALEVILDRIEAEGGTPWLATPPPAFVPAPEAIARLEEFREIVLDLCSPTCGPDFYTLLEQEHFPLMDIHPNDAGYRFIAEAWTVALPEPGAGVLGVTALAVLRALLRTATGTPAARCASPR